MSQGRSSGQSDSPLAIELLSSLLDRLGPIGLATDPTSGRLRVLIDPLGGAQTVGTVTTVTTVTTVAGITNIGGNSTVYDQWAQMQSMVSANRSRIAVS